MELNQDVLKETAQGVSICARLLEKRLQTFDPTNPADVAAVEWLQAIVMTGTETMRAINAYLAIDSRRPASHDGIPLPPSTSFTSVGAARATGAYDEQTLQAMERELARAKDSGATIPAVGPAL